MHRGYDKDEETDSEGMAERFSDYDESNDEMDGIEGWSGLRELDLAKESETEETEARKAQNINGNERKRGYILCTNRKKLITNKLHVEETHDTLVDE